jgi:molybdate/tungstate transport system substrate-binding protein
LNLYRPLLRFCAVLVGATVLLSACGARHTAPTPNPSSSGAGNSAAVTTSPPAIPGAPTQTAALTNAPLPQRGSGTVQLLYAGSLVNLMENSLGPSFQKGFGYHYQGQGGGSVALANQIKDKLRQPDVFISADPTVNDLLEGAKNGDLADWYVVWGRTPIVIAYNPQSKFAPQLDQARDGKLPWYQVLEEPGFRLGRTDPQLDPKGYHTIWMMDLAEKYYDQPELRQKILKSDENTDQIFPEEELVSRLQSGQLDAGVFYLSEVAQMQLPHITLPDQINQGNPQMASLYAQETYTDAKGNVYRGAPILYTATIPSVSRNPAAGAAFIQYLATAGVRQALQERGLLPTDLLVGGDASKVPAQLRPYIKGSYNG